MFEISGPDALVWAGIRNNLHEGIYDELLPYDALPPWC